jgi:ribonuclease Z
MVGQPTGGGLNQSPQGPGVVESSDVEITLLGTGSPLPSADRAGPATLVRAGGATMLFDCGRGVVMRLAAAGVLPIGLSAVLLTHLHSDHITDLNDIVTTHWVMAPGPTPLRVIGPPGTQGVVDGVMAMLASDQEYRLAHHADLTQRPLIDVTEVEPGAEFELADVALSVHRTDHRPVTPTVGYRIAHDGKVAAIAGDTVPCTGLDEMCRDADLYVQTVIRSELVQAIPNARLQDILDYHSSVEQAAQTAARAGVKTLVLTHYVPPMQPGDEEAWKALAAAHFSGTIVLGDDLTVAKA